jgi:hypothetical protein
MAARGRLIALAAAPAAIAGLLVAGSAGAAAAAAKPTVSVLSWHRSGGHDFLALRLCGAPPGTQLIKVVESGADGSRRLSFTTTVTGKACVARNLYWSSGSAAAHKTTIAVQVRSGGGSWSRIVKRSQVV